MFDQIASDEALRVWGDVLHRLEEELRSGATLAEGTGTSTLANTGADWQPPSGTPRLPEALAARAQALVDGQTALLKRLEACRLRARRHLHYLDADGAKGLVTGPRFIDKHA